jgi:hypothetical protein
MILPGNRRNRRRACHRLTWRIDRACNFIGDLGARSIVFEKTPFALLKFVAKAALNVAGFGVAGDLAVEVLPDVARDVWEWWGKGKKPVEVLET